LSTIAICYHKNVILKKWRQRLEQSMRSSDKIFFISRCHGIEILVLWWWHLTMIMRVSSKLRWQKNNQRIKEYRELWPKSYLGYSLRSSRIFSRSLFKIPKYLVMTVVMITKVLRNLYFGLELRKMWWII
jgi:hypothetical protein